MFVELSCRGSNGAIISCISYSMWSIIICVDYVCVFTRIQIHIWPYIIYIHMYICIYICYWFGCVDIYIYVQAHEHAYMRTGIHAYKCAYAYAYRLHMDRLHMDTFRMLHAFLCFPIRDTVWFPPFRQFIRHGLGNPAMQVAGRIIEPGIFPANHGENSCKPKRPNYRPPTLLVYNVNPGLINPVYGRLIGKLPKKVSNHDCWGNTPLINKAWFINPGLTFFPSDLGAVEQLPGQVSLQSKCPMQGLNFGAMLKLVDVPWNWANYNDLTATSLGMMASRGDYPQMTLFQVSEIL